MRTEQDWIEIYKKLEAWWLHDDVPKRPHALLTSGLHSGGFFNSKPITGNPDLCREVADALVLHLAAIMEFTAIQVVVGPATGATKLAEAMAESICRNGGIARWVSPVKIGDGPEKRIVFDDESSKVQGGEKVLICEDVLTTGGSADLTVKAVRECNGEVLPFIAAIVNRSGKDVLNELRVISLISKYMPIWKPDECPLCAMGSEAIRPKNPAENWQRLCAVM